MTCALLGDSIALSLQSALPRCQVQARVGITSEAYARHFNILTRADLSVISLTANDGPTVNLNALRTARSRISGRVVWLIPNTRDTHRNAILTVARENRDTVLDTRPFVGPDGIHLSEAGRRQLVELLPR